jgi:hypothetical protein
VTVELSEAVPLVTGDQLQIIGQLARPAYAWLLWIDQAGQVQVIAHSGKNNVREITYPTASDSWIELTGGPGAEMALLVVSDSDPELPAQLSQRMRAELPIPSFDARQAIWIDQRGITITTPGGETIRSLGPITNQKLQDPQYRVDRVRQILASEMSGFHGVAFPHR